MSADQHPLTAARDQALLLAQRCRELLALAHGHHPLCQRMIERRHPDGQITTEPDGGSVFQAHLMEMHKELEAGRAAIEAARDILVARVPRTGPVKFAGLSGTSATECVLRLADHLWDSAWNSANNAEYRCDKEAHRGGRQYVPCAGTPPVLEKHFPAIMEELTRRFPLLDSEQLMAEIRWEWLKAQHADAIPDLTSQRLAAVLPLADGPRPPSSFFWRGKVCKGLSNLQYNLLAHLWAEGQRLQCVTYEELRERVWDKEVKDTTIPSAVSRLNKQLNEDGIYLGLGTNNYHVICTWG